MEKTQTTFDFAARYTELAQSPDWKYQIEYLRGLETLGVFAMRCDLDPILEVIFGTEFPDNGYLQLMTIIEQNPLPANYIDADLLRTYEQEHLEPAENVAARAEQVGVAPEVIAEYLNN